MSNNDDIGQNCSRGSTSTMFLRQYPRCYPLVSGAMAQLVARLVRNEKVALARSLDFLQK